MRGQMSGVLKLAYNRAIHWFKESHNEMGLPALDIDREFIDPPRHGIDGSKFEFALQPPAPEPDAAEALSNIGAPIRFAKPLADRHSPRDAQEQNMPRPPPPGE
jgi:hypothetical protein